MPFACSRRQKYRTNLVNVRSCGPWDRDSAPRGQSIAHISVREYPRKCFGTHLRRLPRIPTLPRNPIFRGSRIVEKSLAQKCLGLASESTVSGQQIQRLAGMGVSVRGFGEQDSCGLAVSMGSSSRSGTQLKCLRKKVTQKDALYFWRILNC